MVEFALISVLYYYAYGDHKITPPSAPAAVREFLTDRRSPYKVSVSGVQSVETLVYSFPLFVYDVCSVRDILGKGYFAVGDGDGDLSEPLNDNADIESGGRQGSGGSGGGPGRGGAGRGGAGPWGRQSGAAAGYTSVLTTSDTDPDLAKLAIDTRGPSPNSGSGGGGQSTKSPFVRMEDIYEQRSSKSPQMTFNNPDHLSSSVPNSPTVDYSIYGEYSDVADQSEIYNDL